MSSKKKSANQLFDLDAIIDQLPTATGVNLNARKPNKSGGATKATAKLSKNYVEVNKSKLGELPTDTYLRYIDMEGNLKPGGGKFKSIGQNDEGEPILHLSNFNLSTKKYYLWNVKLSEISKIYRYVKDGDSRELPATQNTTTPAPNKPDVSNLQDDKPPTEEDKILLQLGDKMLFSDNELLKQKVDAMDVDLQRIDADLKKIFTLVKRLYKTVFQGQ